jgi:hypothetical protein
MALPKYDKSKRRKTFEQLPKGAYVIRIRGAKEEQNRSGSGTHITIAFDIAEGEYKGIYEAQFQNDTSEDKKWPRDAMFYLTVPEDNSPQYVCDNWNTFFADLEDSNNGFVFAGELKQLKDKLIGGKFHIEQTEWNGRVYDHTRLRWTCVADDVRNDKAGKLPADKLVAAPKQPTSIGSNDFVTIPDDADEEVPF